MFDVILFPTDGSEAARAATDTVFELAAIHHARVHAVHSIELLTFELELDDETRDQAVAEAEAILAAVEAAGEEHDVPTGTSLIDRPGPVAQDILTAAEEVGADVIVLPRRGGTGEFPPPVLGGVTDRVLRLSDVPVVVIPPTGDPAAP